MKTRNWINTALASSWLLFLWFDLFYKPSVGWAILDTFFMLYFAIRASVIKEL
jgi:hypothetical protein